AVVKDEVTPLVQEIAKEASATLIDLFTPLEDKEEFFPDNVHPNAKGAAIMAETIYVTIVPSFEYSSPTK
ncbi:hypothetical protein OAB00_04545, partial [Akkermansiaceae bacterium]|nr:hypothetical protein [Akkermansiaceae bacterium]